MSKKILTVLAPVAAIVAFMAVPSLTQATEVQCGPAECFAGSLIRGQSNNLTLQTQAPHNIQTCVNTSLQGNIQVPQGPTVFGDITGAAFTGCTHSDQVNTTTVDVTANATPAEPWQLQIQQPAGAEPGAPFIAHINPFPGKKIEIQKQVQMFGFSTAHCRFSANSIQLQGFGQNDTLAVTEGQFQLQERRLFEEAQCGIVNATLGHLSGNIQLETHEANPKPVVVHMTEPV